jgi:hypothetical protein
MLCIWIQSNLVRSCHRAIASPRLVPFPPKTGWAGGPVTVQDLMRPEGLDLFEDFRRKPRKESSISGGWLATISGFMPISLRAEFRCSLPPSWGLTKQMHYYYLTAPGLAKGYRRIRTSRPIELPRKTSDEIKSKRETQRTESTKQLDFIVRRVWDCVTPEVISASTQSMPRRCRTLKEL